MFSKMCEQFQASVKVIFVLRYTKLILANSTLHTAKLCKTDCITIQKS